LRLGRDLVGGVGGVVWSGFVVVVVVVVVL
jgi:hypothetical protein